MPENPLIRAIESIALRGGLSGNVSAILIRAQPLLGTQHLAHSSKGDKLSMWL